MPRGRALPHTSADSRARRAVDNVYGVVVLDNGVAQTGGVVEERSTKRELSDVACEGAGDCNTVGGQGGASGACESVVHVVGSDINAEMFIRRSVHAMQVVAGIKLEQYDD